MLSTIDSDSEAEKMKWPDKIYVGWTWRFKATGYQKEAGMSIWEKIKLLFKVKEPAEKLLDGIKGFKSGWKTVSFWVTLLASLGSMVAALHGIIPPEASLIATTLLTMLYNTLRGFEKMDQNAVRPTLQSTEFWLGILGMVSNAITSLQTGGIHPDWLITAQSSIAGVMAVAQNLGARQPEKQDGV